MASYGTDADVQVLAYGAANSSLDTKTTKARDVATSIINAHLGLKSDMTTVPNLVNECCNLLAVGFVKSGPNDDISNNGHYKAGLLLLENLSDDVEEGDLYKTIAVDGFGRFSEGNHFDTSGFIQH